MTGDSDSLEDDLTEWLVEEGLTVNIDHRVPRWRHVYTPRQRVSFHDDAARNLVASRGWQG